MVASNLALFGRPIEQGGVTVKCINRMVLTQVGYMGHFGPVTFWVQAQRGQTPFAQVRMTAITATADMARTRPAVVYAVLRAVRSYEQ